MKKTTLNLKNKNAFNKRLAQYGALSLAIAGVADANGQIVYTDVDPDFVGVAQSSFDFDFNSDAIIDATIEQTSFAGPAGPIQLLRTVVPSGNGVVVNVVGAYTYGVNVTLGSAIGPAAAVASFGDMCQGPGYTNSQFCATTEDSFVGIAFEVTGNTHYGWIRLSAGSSPSNFTVQGYAYESTPNTAINAGQTLGVDEFSNNTIKVVALNRSIGLYNLPQATEYRVMDISGKSILNGTTNGDSYVIEANGIASGIYIIELSDNNSNSVLRKKIVL